MKRHGLGAVIVLFHLCAQRQSEICWQEITVTEWGHNDGPQVVADGESAEQHSTGLQSLQGREGVLTGHKALPPTFTSSWL